MIVNAIPLYKVCTSSDYYRITVQDMQDTLRQVVFQARLPYANHLICFNVISVNKHHADVEIDTFNLNETGRAGDLLEHVEFQIPIDTFNRYYVKYMMARTMQVTYGISAFDEQLVDIAVNFYNDSVTCYRYQSIEIKNDGSDAE